MEGACSHGMEVSSHRGILVQNLPAMHAFLQRDVDLTKPAILEHSAAAREGAARAWSDRRDKDSAQLPARKLGVLLTAAGDMNFCTKVRDQNVAETGENH